MACRGYAEHCRKHLNVAVRMASLDQLSVACFLECLAWLVLKSILSYVYLNRHACFLNTAPHFSVKIGSISGLCFQFLVTSIVLIPSYFGLCLISGAVLEHSHNGWVSLSLSILFQVKVDSHGRFHCFQHR